MTRHTTRTVLMMSMVAVALIAAAGCKAAVADTPADTGENPLAVEFDEENMRGSDKALDLSSHKWNDRVLLLFAPSSRDETYNDQVAEITGRTSDPLAVDREVLEQMRERDLVVYHLFERGIGRVGPSYDRVQTSKSGGSVPLDASAARVMRDRLGVDEGTFTAILIGKDGTEKLRRETNVVRTEALFALIDSMPMRPEEMASQ